MDGEEKSGAKKRKDCGERVVEGEDMDKGSCWRKGCRGEVKALA